MQILYSSETLLAVHKPPGVPFHQDENRAGVMTLFREAEASGVLPTLGPLFPVHRLDAVTSGILLLARNRDTARQVGQAFANRQIDKLYVALSAKRPNKKQGRVSGDMARSRRGTWKLTRTHENPAVTRFVTRAIPGRRPGLRLFCLKLETGRTHQLRVAMKSLGSPVLGDPVYGSREEAKLEERTYLHACALRFSLGDEVISLVCPPNTGAEFLSDEFRQSWELLGDLWSLF